MGKHLVLVGGACPLNCLMQLKHFVIEATE
jgi:hypothetical protein